jgi:hypothetical protein
MLFATEPDFEAQALAAGVNVFFKPTQSHYSFLRLSGEHVCPSGPLSRNPSIHHAGPTRDAVEYDATQVLEMAYQVALKAAFVHATELVLRRVTFGVAAALNLGASTVQPEPDIKEPQPNGSPVPSLTLRPNATEDSFDRSLIKTDEAQSQAA